MARVRDWEKRDMSGTARFLFRSFFIAATLTIIAAPAAMQTTIFDIPTADTLPRDSWNLEADFIAKPVRYRDGGYQTYGYRVAYGLGHTTEVGSNFYYTYDGSEHVAQVELSAKQKVYQNEKHGVTVSGGAVAFVPLKSRNGDKTSVIVYANAGKTITG